MSIIGKPSVFISRPIPFQGLIRLTELYQVTMHDSELVQTREEFLKSIPGMDALLIHPGSVIDKESLDIAGAQLKVISTFSVGLDHIDVNLCKERGIKVGYTPEVLTTAVAEHAIGLTLATARRVKESFQMINDGTWGKRWENCLWLAGKEISGSVVGIVGLGRIGAAIAKRLAGFEVSKILYTSRNRNYEAEATLGTEYVSFNELLQQSDFVIAACSVNSSNSLLFNESAFRQMKPSSVFINITRGSLVDQEALYNALTSGQIGAAGLDVTTPEPLPPSHPLLALPNCVVTPHLGSATTVSRNGMCDLAVENLIAGLEDRPLERYLKQWIPEFHDQDQ